MTEMPTWLMNAMAARRAIDRSMPRTRSATTARRAEVCPVPGSLDATDQARRVRPTRRMTTATARPTATATAIATSIGIAVSAAGRIAPTLGRTEADDGATGPV